MKGNALARPVRLAAIVAILLSLCACDHAVRSHIGTRYIIEGDPQSAIYPKEVEPRDEDVLITLKEGAPRPEVLLIEAGGRETRFPFATEGSMLVVPAKFGRLRLRHESDSPVDVVEQTAAK